MAPAPGASCYFRPWWRRWASTIKRFSTYWKTKFKCGAGSSHGKRAHDSALRLATAGAVRAHRVPGSPLLGLTAYAAKVFLAIFYALPLVLERIMGRGQPAR